MIRIKSVKQLMKYLDKKTNTIVINDDIEIAFDGFDIKHNLRCKNIISKE